MSELAKWDSFLRNCRVGCGRADRIAVRRAHADCREAAGRGCRGRGRVWEPYDRSFRRRLVFVGASARSLAKHYDCRSSLGTFGLCRSGVHGDRSPAHAKASRIQTNIRGLVVSCGSAVGRLRNPRAVVIIRVSILRARGPVWCRRCGAAVALHRHTQRLGQRFLSRIRSQDANKHRAKS